MIQEYKLPTNNWFNEKIEIEIKELPNTDGIPCFIYTRYFITKNNQQIDLDTLKENIPNKLSERNMLNQYILKDISVDKKVITYREYEETYKDYIIYIERAKNLFPTLTSFLDWTNNKEYFNGYIIIPKTSKFYKELYYPISIEIGVLDVLNFNDFIGSQYVIGIDNTDDVEDGIANKYAQNKEVILKDLRKVIDLMVEKENICIDI